MPTHVEMHVAPVAPRYQPELKLIVDEVAQVEVPKPVAGVVETVPAAVLAVVMDLVSGSIMLEIIVMVDVGEK